MRVLYVEDDPRDADLTLRMLARTAPHLATEAVSTIAEAYERLARTDDPEPIDLVLTDMNLRDGNGLSLLNYIRQSSLPVAVVIVTLAWLFLEGSEARYTAIALHTSR